jgi:hypothetical protein
MSGPADEDVQRIVDGFRGSVLPKSEWTHTAHLIAGTWHVYHLGAAAALEALRAAILALNDFHGTPNTDTRGYHETITRAHVILIDGQLTCLPSATAFDAVRTVLGSDLANPRGLLRYYSETRLMSVEARRGWREPDREPLPERRIEISRPEAQSPKPEARVSPAGLPPTSPRRR